MDRAIRNGERILFGMNVFPHVARLNLREELLSSEIANVVGPDGSDRWVARPKPCAR
jgi:hypothetical protein